MKILPAKSGRSVVLTAALMLCSAAPASAADLDQQAFNKAMDSYLQSDANLEKVGDALEGFYKKKQADRQKEAMEKQRAAMEEEKQRVEEQFKNPVKVEIGQSPVRGPKDAPITIVEFSDFQCPFCQKGANLMEEVMKAYPGKVNVAFKNLPLPFHPQAMPSAKAALAAGKQGKFWEMHDKLFANQQSLGPDFYNRTAEELGLDVSKFKKDMEDPALQKLVEQDMELANSLGVRGTPGFFVNGVMLRGAVPIEQFKEIIDRWLAQGPK